MHSQLRALMAVLIHKRLQLGLLQPNNHEYMQHSGMSLSPFGYQISKFGLHWHLVNLYMVQSAITDSRFIERLMN